MLAGYAPSKYHARFVFVSSYFLSALFLIIMPWYGLSKTTTCSSTDVFGQGTTRSWSW
jgi:hypothetical protein